MKRDSSDADYSVIRCSKKNRDTLVQKIQHINERHKDDSREELAYQDTLLQIPVVEQAEGDERR